MERWYKYAAMFVGITLSSVIGTVTVLSYFKSTVKEAVTEALDPVKKRIEILENKQTDLSAIQTNLALLTYRINAIDKPCGPSFSNYKSKKQEANDFDN